MVMPQSDGSEVPDAPRRPSLWSKISLLYRWMMGVAAVGLLAGLAPVEVLGQQCGSLFVPKRSRLQDVFGPMTDSACSNALADRLPLVVFAGVILFVMFCFMIQARRERSKR